MDVLDDYKVLLGVNTTSPMKGLNVILYAGKDEVFRTTADVAPDKPYVKIINIDKNIDKNSLKMVLAAADGKADAFIQAGSQGSGEAASADCRAPETPAGD